MARPKADVEAVRERLLAAAEEIIRSNDATRLTVSDIAAVVGMGQSNVYRYVRSRHHLVELLAQRWFGAIEAAVAGSIAGAATPQDRIARWVIETMAQKTARYDDDPALFGAYLDLAKGHDAVVAAHVGRLRDLVKPSVAALVGQRHVPAAFDLLEDATAQFRTPHLIVLHRPRLTAERAMAVVDAVLLKFAALSRSDQR